MSRQPAVPRKFEDFLKRRDEYNIIFPSEKVLEVSPVHKLVPEVIRISADPKDGDVWRVGYGTDEKGGWTEIFSFSKRGLQRIAQAAGIVFDPRFTRRSDDGHNPRRVEFQASGSIQKPDGTWYSVTHSKEVDLNQVEAEERMRLERDALDGEIKVGEGDQARVLQHGTPECTKEMERRLRHTMMMWNKNKVAFADTGAHNRVVRALLILKPFYTKEELSKPFVLPRVSLNVDYLLKSVDLKQHFIEGGLTTIFQMFGPPKRYEFRPDRFFVTLEEKRERQSREGGDGKGSADTLADPENGGGR